MHIGVFILLLLSGERNFGVRLNKPYTATVPMDIPVFTGSHADLLITVFHKIIATGHQRLQPLFDCLLTILVNGKCVLKVKNQSNIYAPIPSTNTHIHVVSPYLKTLSMVAAIKLLHLLEAFSTPWFLFSAPANHHLVFFLLEIFNNIIQYQFDGNSNLVYTIIRKRHVFHALANLPSDLHGISKCLYNRKGGGGGGGMRTSRLVQQPQPVAAVTKPSSAGMTHSTSAGNISSRTSAIDGEDESSDGDAKSDIGELSMEGSKPAQPAEPGTLKVSLLDTPGTMVNRDIALNEKSLMDFFGIAIGQMTERESAHPTQPQFDEFSPMKDDELIAEIDSVPAVTEIIESVRRLLGFFIFTFRDHLFPPVEMLCVFILVFLLEFFFFLI